MASSIFYGIHRNMVSRLREVIIDLYSALMKSHLEYCAQFWSSQYKSIRGNQDGYEIKTAISDDDEKFNQIASMGVCKTT